MAEQRPRIMYFKEYLPTPVCVVLSMFFALVFQFNGGVFLPTAVQMSSALGCIQEDVMMAGYASFIGMTLISRFFPPEIPFYYAKDFPYSLSGTDCLQPHHTACQQSSDLYPRLFSIRFLPHVGNL